MKSLKISDRFTIKQIPFNFVVVETISVNPDHHLAKGKKTVRTKENYFTKLSQACEWILNKSVELESVDAVLESIRKAKTEIVSGDQWLRERAVQNDADKLNSVADEILRNL